MSLATATSRRYINACLNSNGHHVCRKQRPAVIEPEMELTVPLPWVLALAGEVGTRTSLDFLRVLRHAHSIVKGHQVFDIIVSAKKLTGTLDQLGISVIFKRLLRSSYGTEMRRKLWNGRLSFYVMTC